MLFLDPSVFVHLQAKRNLLFKSELKRSNPSALSFFLERRNEFMKTKPTESGIFITPDGEIVLCNKEVSLYSIVCVAYLLNHTLMLNQVDLRINGLTKQHLEALDIALDDNKVGI